MASRDLTLILEVETGKAVIDIKNVSKQLKGLEATSLSKEVSVSSDKMKEMAAETARIARDYKQIAISSRDDWERLQKRVRLEKQRAAVINRAHGEALAMEKKRSAEINKANDKIRRQTKLLDKQRKSLKSIKQYLFALRSYWLAISAAISIATISVVKFFKSGFMAVEKFRLSVASMAASITTFSDLSAGNVDEVYANAVLYAEELAIKMELINVRTIATGEQLRAMNETFIQQGVLLDVNSKKQEDAFVSVANAISLITQGQNQEIQMRQEIRGLISGDIRATNLLARMIDTKLGGSLKENIKKWKQQGTLLENLAKHLEGFAVASADLSKTWAALSTTFETIINRHLRAGFKPIYADIIEKSLELSRSMLGQKEASESISDSLRMGMSKTWETIKNVVQVVLDVFWWMKQPLQLVWEFVKVIADAFGHFFALIAPITSRFRDLTKSVQSTVMAILRLGEAAWRVASFDFAGAKEQFTQAKTAWKEGGKILGKAFGEGLGLEIALSLADYADPVFMKKLKGDLPELGVGTSEEGLKKAEDWFKTWERMEEENQKNRIKIKYDGYAQSVLLLELEKNKLVEIYGEQEAIIKHFELKLALLNRDEEKRKKEAHDKLIEYISSERENKTRAIMEEVTMMANLAKTQEELNKIRKVGQKNLDALETEAAEKRAADHEQILQFISIKEENEIKGLLATQEELLKKTDILSEQNAIRERTSELIAKVTEEESTGLQKWAEEAKSFEEIASDVAISAANSFSSGFADAFVDFATGVKSAKDAFIDFAKSFLDQIAKMIIQQLILNALKETTKTAPAVSIAASMMTVAKGAAFSNGNKMTEYARGGIVSSPTIFPMANGMGLMGEAGPEAIMPLKRGKGGKLGIEGGAQSKSIVNINLINPTFQDVETQRQVFAQIADTVTRQIAPEVIVQNYQDDGAIRQMVRGGV